MPAWLQMRVTLRFEKFGYWIGASHREDLTGEIAS